ncbi:MAG: hypothetical protein HC785_16545 [Calothrix sp. CSU_2_0]|nr:hypothetical protein [Calothrix sp. CSU_2_0]
MTQVREPGTNELIAIAIAPLTQRLVNLEGTVSDLLKDKFKTTKSTSTSELPKSTNLEELRDKVLMECQPTDRRKIKKALNSFIASI